MEMCRDIDKVAAHDGGSPKAGTTVVTIYTNVTSVAISITSFFSLILKIFFGGEIIAVPPTAGFFG